MGQAERGDRSNPAPCLHKPQATILLESILTSEAGAYCIVQLNCIFSGVPYDKLSVSEDPGKVNGFHPVKNHPGSSRLETCLGSEAVVVA